MKFFILTIFSLLISFPVTAQEFVPIGNVQSQISGKDLMHMCQGRYDIDYGYCAGYLAAVSEIMLEHQVYGQTACNQGPVATQQLMELYRQHMKENPTSQMQPASAATAQALSRFFHCRY